MADVLTGFAFDYFLKDHLGNVRAVVTDEVQQDRYPTATLEGTGTGSPAAQEQAYYDINSNYVVPKPPAVPNYTNDNGANNPNTFGNKTANSEKMYKLHAATNKTGLGMVLKVMSGDKLNLLAKSWYKRNTGTTVTNAPFMATELLQSFIGQGGNPATQHGATLGMLTGNTTGTLNPVALFSNNNAPGSNNVKAGLCYILFDEQFKYVSGGYDPVNANDTGGLKAHFMQQVAVPKNGYLYVYCSNESNLEMFFDNLEVVHDRGALLEETHYYPFGLTMAGISSKGAGKIDNKYKFNEGTELANKEFSDGSGLDLYETNHRSLDGQIGRFWQIDPMADEGESHSPFAYVFNNPIRFNDPLGLDTSTRKQNLDPVTVVGTRQAGTSAYAGGLSMRASPTGILPPLGGQSGSVPPLEKVIPWVRTASRHPLAAAAVATVMGQVIISELDRKLREGRWYIVYKKVGPNGEVYIGRCSGLGNSPQDVLDRYDRGHRLKGYGDAQILDVLNGSITEAITPPAGNTFVLAEISGYSATRGREQQQYAFYKNAGYTMGNIINPVWKYNPLAPTYFAASNLAFGPLVPYTDQW